MEKLFHLLSKADLSTVLLILLQNPTPAITSSFLFLSFIFLSTFFPLSAYKCGSFPLFLKQNRKHLTWFSFLLRLLFFFSPSLDTKIFHRIDSLTNLASLPPHFLTIFVSLSRAHQLSDSVHTTVVKLPMQSTSTASWLSKPVISCHPLVNL